MDLGISDKVKPILAEVKHFIDTEILPLREEYHARGLKVIAGLSPSARLKFWKDLKAKAKAKNLWNFFLTHFEGGHGLKHC